MINNVLRESIKKMYYFIGGFKLTSILVKHNKGIAAILMYHRVLPEKEIQKDWTNNSISLREFEQHMQYITKNYIPVPIDEISLERKNDGRLPSRHNVR